MNEILAESVLMLLGVATGVATGCMGAVLQQGAVRCPR